jgi:hypothetical protein
MKEQKHRGIDLPIFEETLKKFNGLSNSYSRDEKGRWISDDPKEGWYQNHDGQLFHYDGVIWDEVPSERIEKLEYLG